MKINREHLVWLALLSGLARSDIAPEGGRVKFSLVDQNAETRNFTAGIVIARIAYGKVGSVCSGGIDQHSARVLCQELGLGRAVDWFGIDRHRLRYGNKILKKTALTNIICPPEAEVLGHCTIEYARGTGSGCPVHGLDWKTGIVTITTKILALACTPRPGECTVNKRNGFLKTTCQRLPDIFEVYKCVNSNTYYTKFNMEVVLVDEETAEISRSCPNEGEYGRYQVCGLTPDIPQADTLCTQATCVIPEISVSMALRVMSTETVCTFKGVSNQDIFSCTPRPGDEYCSKVGRKVKDQVKQCDMICQDPECRDEAVCNGYRYGIVCSKDQRRQHIPTFRICDDLVDCDDRSDERECITTAMAHKIGYCTSILTDVFEVKLTNFTRCGPIKRYRDNVLVAKSTSLCEYFEDQLNCSDPERGVLHCLHRGFPATVSRGVICVAGVALCDDNLDQECVTPSDRCKIHKHLLCNGVKDCDDGSDEVDRQCGAVLSTTCFRRYNHSRELGIPVAWLHDGVEDCVSGVDESSTVWPTCKMPSRDILQRVVENTTCSNVFICNQGSLDYIPLSGLCDGTEDCGEERSVCHASRSTTPMFVSALVFRGTRHLSYCIPGLGSMRADHDLRCRTQDFLTPDYPVFGATIATISLPSNKMDCKYAYGELYVFLSCTGRCKDSPCPLTSIKYTKCENNPRTAMSLARSQYLTPVLREKLAYHNRLFQCDNRNCIGYDAVCNLVDDCGDGSDERMCTNSYKCTSKNHYISLTQKCDGKMDCMDHSDECNDECNKEIIEGVVFKALAWIIGGTAVFMNVITLWKGIFHPWIENKVGMTNRGFKVLISIGDFLTGIYLLLLAIVDFSLKNGKYCRAQLTWLTSDGCATLGLINNIGANLSLFSMTYLSIFRVLNVLVWQVESKFLLLKMGTIVTLIVVCSITIACFPLGSAFEDFFVNGIAYSDMSLFIGPADKARHQAVLRAYFGKISQRDMTWSRITNLLSLMFTNDYGEIKSRRIHFYGNEGVCLFKYFVRSNDPQNMYVWTILVINFVCFLTMSGCYLVLNTKVKRSGRGLRQMMAHSGNNMESTLDKRTEKLQHSITRIIVTDFVCWIPFLVICVLHSTWLIDATFLYSVSSIVILPINSIINPLIYDDFMVSWLSRLKDRILMTKSRVERKQGAPEIQIVLSKISTEYNNAPA